MAERPASFDPVRMLQVLDRHRVNYIVIGALARVIHGADEITAGLDITPSTRPENLRRLEAATQELGGDSAAIGAAEKPVRLNTEAGELKIVPVPEGTNGYDDLRRAARREPLGQGVRPEVASLGDLARMLAAHQPNHERLQELRQIAEIERSLGRGL